MAYAILPVASCAHGFRWICLSLARARSCCGCLNMHELSRHVFTLRTHAHTHSHTRRHSIYIRQSARHVCGYFVLSASRRCVYSLCGISADRAKPMVRQHKHEHDDTQLAAAVAQVAAAPAGTHRSTATAKATYMPQAQQQQCLCASVRNKHAR